MWVFLSAIAMRDRNVPGWGDQHSFAISMIHYHCLTDAIEIALPLACSYVSPSTLAISQRSLRYISRSWIRLLGGILRGGLSRRESTPPAGEKVF